MKSRTRTRICKGVTRRQEGTTTQRGYGWDWQQLRKAYRQQYPWCVRCLLGGMKVLATQIDHIQPHKGNPALRLDFANLQGLCDRCHNSCKRAFEYGKNYTPMKWYQHLADLPYATDKVSLAQLPQHLQTRIQHGAPQPTNNSTIG